MAACGAGRGNWLLGFDPPFTGGPEMLIAVPWPWSYHVSHTCFFITCCIVLLVMVLLAGSEAVHVAWAHKETLLHLARSLGWE